MPRAAVLSIHARVKATEPSDWEHPSLAQVWGPRFSVYVVPRRDVAVFTLGRLPDAPKDRQKALDLAERVHAIFGGEPVKHEDAVRPLKLPHHNYLRYGAASGRLLIRWDGARQPTVWTTPPSKVDPFRARLELARRYLHVFGPATASSFAAWAGIGDAEGRAAFDALARELIAVRTPIGDAVILAMDEPSFRARPRPAAPARLLPSGDAYTLLKGAERELLVPDPRGRAALWTPRVWPGAVLVSGEIVGTWRRDGVRLTIGPWRRLTRVEREALEAEVGSLPLADLGGPPPRALWEAGQLS